MLVKITQSGVSWRQSPQGTLMGNLSFLVTIKIASTAMKPGCLRFDQPANSPDFLLIGFVLGK